MLRESHRIASGEIRAQQAKAADIQARHAVAQQRAEALAEAADAARRQPDQGIEARGGGGAEAQQQAGAGAGAEEDQRQEVDREGRASTPDPRQGEGERQGKKEFQAAVAEWNKQETKAAQERDRREAEEKAAKDEDRRQRREARRQEKEAQEERARQAVVNSKINEHMQREFVANAEEGDPSVLRRQAAGGGREG